MLLLERSSGQADTSNRPEHRLPQAANVRGLVSFLVNWHSLIVGGEREKGAGVPLFGGMPLCEWRWCWLNEKGRRYDELRNEGSTNGTVLVRGPNWVGAVGKRGCA